MWGNFDIPQEVIFDYLKFLDTKAAGNVYWYVLLSCTLVVPVETELQDVCMIKKRQNNWRTRPSDMGSAVGKVKNMQLSLLAIHMAPRPLNRKNIQGPETYKERKEFRSTVRFDQWNHTLFSPELLPPGLRIRIRIQSGQWIRIRIWNPDPDPGGHKWPTKVNFFKKKFHVLKCWMFSYEKSWRLLL